MKIILLNIFFGLICLSFACSSKQENVLSTNSDKITSVVEKPQPTSTPLIKSESESREELESQILKGENLHDGAIGLTFIGDINSVPALLSVLKKYPPDRYGVNVCTAGHAVEALEKITKTKAGYKFDDWNNWWIKYQKKHKIKSK